MRRPAVFFDRDNTLIVGSEYLGDPNGVVLVAGAPAAVAKCRALGFAVVVVSNQSGVARGMFTDEAVREVNKRMDRLLLDENPAAVIDRHEFCPFHPDAVVEAYRQDSFLRKPKPGMILAAADAMALDLARSWLVGDAPRDITAGKAAGCRTILINDPSLAPSPAALEAAAVAPDFTVGSLIEAVEVIARHQDRPPAPAVDANADTVIAAESAEPAGVAQLTKAASPAPSERPTSERPTVDVSRVGPIAAAMVQQPSAQAPSATTTPSAPTPPATPAAASGAPTTTPPAASPAGAAGSPKPAPTSPFVVGKPITAAKATPATGARPAATRPAPAATPAAARPASTQAASPAGARVDFSRLETVNQQILVELKKLNDARSEDFSVSKLVAGIMQILALAVVPLGYMLHRPDDAASLANWLLVAVFLQTFTVALLIMSRQK